MALPSLLFFALVVLASSTSTIVALSATPTVDDSEMREQIGLSKGRFDFAVPTYVKNFTTKAEAHEHIKRADVFVVAFASRAPDTCKRCGAMLEWFAKVAAEHSETYVKMRIGFGIVDVDAVPGELDFMSRTYEGVSKWAMKPPAVVLFKFDHHAKQQGTAVPIAWRTTSVGNANRLISRMTSSIVKSIDRESQLVAQVEHDATHGVTFVLWPPEALSNAYRPTLTKIATKYREHVHFCMVVTTGPLDQLAALRKKFNPGKHVMTAHVLQENGTISTEGVTLASGGGAHVHEKQLTAFVKRHLQFQRRLAEVEDPTVIQPPTVEDEDRIDEEGRTTSSTTAPKKEGRAAEEEL